MKAVLLDGFGGPEVLQVAETETPSAATGQVRIKVMATSVNRADIIQREGHYPPPRGESEILGLEVAGVIDELGGGVRDWKTGDRVMSLVAGGGYAEYAIAYADHLLPIPDGLGDEAAACICETYITAYLNIFLLGHFGKGQSILIHGGGGGVNTAAIQLCRSLVPDSKIIVTASPAKIERVKAIGANCVINYREQDFAKEVRNFTGQKGVNLILDHIGAAYLERNMKSLAYEGKLIIIGVIGGSTAKLNLAHMMVKRQSVIGSVIRSRSIEEKGRITAEFKKHVLPLFEDRSIVPLIYKTFDLDQVAEAHRTMEESRHFGKIALKVTA